MNRSTKLLLACALFLTTGQLSALADPYFDKGVQLFNKKQFAQALPYFHKAVEDSPWDSTACYYNALTYQYMGDWKHAKEAYRSLADRFPGTPAGNNAIAALKRLDPDYFKQKAAAAKAASDGAGGGSATATASTASDPAAELDKLMAKVEYSGPSQSKVPLTKQLDRNIVDGQLNNRSVKFDFGGEETVISPKEAVAFGITDANRAPVKNGTRVPATIKLGSFTAAKFPILVENTDRPKLGTDFFSKLAYTLEPTQIVITKKESTAKSGWDIPFRKSGKDMLVEVMVNGRRVPMVLDVNASECVVPKRRAKEFGLEVQESSTVNQFNAVTNPNGPIRGQDGFGDEITTSFAEAKMQFGPVSNGALRIKIDENAKEAKLGTGALSGWKYTVDSASGMIRFSR